MPTCSFYSDTNGDHTGHTDHMYLQSVEVLHRCWPRVLACHTSHTEGQSPWARWEEAESPVDTTRLHWTRCHTDSQFRNQAVDYAVVVLSLIHI